MGSKLTALGNPALVTRSIYAAGSQNLWVFSNKPLDFHRTGENVRMNKEKWMTAEELNIYIISCNKKYNIYKHKK